MIDHILNTFALFALPYTIGLFVWAKTGHALTLAMLAIPVTAILIAMARIARDNVDAK